MTVLLCITTVIFNITTMPLNDQDLKAVKRANDTCRTDDRYKVGPCLKKFIKRDEATYWALCGSKEEYSE